MAHRLLAVIPGLYGGVGFWGILGCAFWYDDFYWLFRWLHVPTSAFLLDGAPGHLLLVRNGIVAATAGLIGFEPRPWFATMLLSHVAAAVALGAVLRQWTGSAWIAAAVASVWAAAPLHAGTLSWYSAGTHAWSTLAVVASLLAWPPSGRPHPALAALALCCAGSTFGTGLAVVIAGPLLVVLVRPGDIRSALWAGLALLATVSTYIALGAGMESVVANPTIARAMAIGGAIDHPVTAVKLGVALLWTGASDLVPGPVAAAGLLGVICAGLLRPATRRVTAAGLLVSVASYGAIAVGRAGLVGTLGLPLWQVADSAHYHYAGQLGMALAAGAALAGFVGKWEVPAAQLILAAAAIRLIVAPPAIDTHASTRQAFDELNRRTAIAAERGVPLRNRAFPPALTLALFATPDRFPGEAAAFSLLHPDGTRDGKPVRFIAQNEEEYAAVENGGPIARILLPPETRTK